MENRKISDLLELGDKIYIYLGTTQVENKFMIDAQAEGFHFGDGKKPTKRKAADIMVIDKNKELCYLGYVGRINFKRDCCDVPKIDYKKYVSYEKNYLYNKQ